MVRFSSFRASLIVAVLVAVTSNAETVWEGHRRPTHLEDAYILTIACPRKGAFANDLVVISDAVDGLESKILRAFPKARTRQRFKSDLLCGLSLQFPAGTTRQELASFEAVESVSRVKLDHQKEVAHPLLAKSVIDRVRRARKLHSRGSANSRHGTTWSPHTMTGIDTLHEKGLLGSRSVRICFIDSGVDYFHPRLGNGCFGPNCKFAFGHDFCGDDGNSPTAIPYTNCSKHGTHNAGTAAADYDADYGMSGAAPGATFGMYRIYSCTGAAPSDAQLSALLRAADDRCDVLSMSFARDMGWDADDLDDPNRPVMNKLEARGIFIVASAGNDGNQGFLFTKTPADLPAVLSTGSLNPWLLPIGYGMSFESGNYPSMRYLSLKPVNYTNSFDVYFQSTLTQGDTSCTPLPRNGTRFDTKLVVIREGQCSAAARSWFAANGARVVIIFQGSVAPSYLSQGKAYDTSEVPGLGWLLRFSDADALSLLDRYTKGKGTLKVNFRSTAPLPQSKLVDSQDGGIISAFSEYGPTATLDNLATHLVGPGTSALSTVPIKFGEYEIHSGTSVVTPLVAGIAGLLLSHRKDDHLTPAQIRALLVTTSNPVHASHPTATSLTTVYRQGGGLVSADRAFLAKTFVEPYQIAVYDSPRHITKHVITLANTNLRAVTYTFDSVASQTMAAYNKSAYQDVSPSSSPSVVHGSAKVSFEPPKMTIPAGQTATFTVSIEQPIFGADDLARVPAYGGWVVINAHGDPVDIYRVPYFGIGADLSSVPIFDKTSTLAASNYGVPGLTYPFLVEGNGIDSSTYPSVPKDKIVPSTNKVTTLTREQGVNIIYRLAMSTARLYIDIVFANISQPIRWSAPGSTPTTSKQFSSIAIGNMIWYGGLTRKSNPLANFPSLDLQVGVFHGPMYADIEPTSVTTTQLASHTEVRILLRALRLGKPVDDYSEASYETWLSPSFMFTD